MNAFSIVQDIDLFLTTVHIQYRMTFCSATTLPSTCVSLVVDLLSGDSGLRSQGIITEK